MTLFSFKICVVGIFFFVARLALRKNTRRVFFGSKLVPMNGGSRLHLSTSLERFSVLSVALHRMMYVAQRLLQKI